MEEYNQLLMRLLLTCEDVDAKILKFDMTGPKPTVLLEIEDTGEGPVTLTYESEKDEWV